MDPAKVARNDDQHIFDLLKMLNNWKRMPEWQMIDADQYL